MYIKRSPSLKHKNSTISRRFNTNPKESQHEKQVKFNKRINQLFNKKMHIHKIREGRTKNLAKTLNNFFLKLDLQINGTYLLELYKIVNST